jgi:hypothetical protein
MNPRNAARYLTPRWIRARILAAEALYAIGRGADRLGWRLDIPVVPTLTVQQGIRRADQPIPQASFGFRYPPNVEGACPVCHQTHLPWPR